MDEQIAGLLRLLDDSHAAVREAVATVPPEARGRKPAPDRWSVAEILEHLALVNARFARVVAAAIAEAGAAGQAEPGLGAPFEAAFRARVVDRTEKRQAPAISTPTGLVDAERAWAAMEAAHAEFRRVVAEASGLHLGHVRAEHPRWGTLTFCQYAELTAGHEQRHAAQIRELAAEGGQTPSTGRLKV